MGEKIGPNICKELSCSACCRYVKMETGSFMRKKAFPDAVEVTAGQNIDEIEDDGVHYQATSKKTPDLLDTYDKVVINGPCPNLTDEGDCGLYKYRGMRPEACKALAITSSDCNIRRIETGLMPIKREKCNQSNIVFVPLSQIIHEPSFRDLRESAQ